MSPRIYGWLAELVLLIHFGFVVFVVLGFVVIWAGFFFRWEFVRNFSLRLAHLLAMGIVLSQALGGVICPLTKWEDQLRRLAGQGERYEGSFIQHWVHRVMFFEFSEGVFTLLYLLFFSTILLTFWFVPPRLPWRSTR